MRKKIFLISFILITSVLVGQNLVLSSKVFKNEETPVPLKSLGYDNDYFYFLNGKGDNLKVEKFTKDSLNRVYSKDVSLDKKRDVKLKDAFFVNGNSLIFRQDYNADNEQITLFMQIVKDNGEIVPDLKEIYSFKSKLKRYYYDSNFKVWDNLIYYHFALSPDKKTLAIVAEEYFWDGRDMNLKKIHLKYLDTEKQNVISEKSIPMQYETTKVFPWNYKIDNHFNIYFCMNYYNKENKLQYAIGCLTKDGSSIIAMDHVLNTSRHFYVDMDYIIDNSKVFTSLLYTTTKHGEYLNDKNYNRFMGLSTSVFSLLDYKLIEADSAHFTDNIINRIQKNKEKYDGFFLISEMTIVNGELYTVVVKDIGTLKGSIIIFKNGNDHKISWSRLLYREYSVYYYYLNYKDKDFIHVVNTEKGINVLYGEDFRSTKMKPEDLSVKKSYATTEEKAYLVSASIDSQGNIERKAIFKPKLTPTYHVDRNGIEVDRFNSNSKIFIPDGDKSCILLFTKKNKFQFSKFLFQ